MIAQDTFDEEAVFDLLKRYFKKYDIASLQKRSYDHFLTHRLNRIIDEEPLVEVSLKKNEFYRVEFGQVFVDRPYIVDEKRTIQYIYPNEALLRDLTYSSVLSVNITTKHYTVEDDETTIHEEKTHHKIPIARLPMMVGCHKCNLSHMTPAQRLAAGQCEYDTGGYFIIKGKERVLVAQERATHNTVYIFDKKSTDQKHLMVAEIRSMSDETGHSVLIQMKICPNHRVVVAIPFITQDVPLGFILMAYGMEVNDIEQLIRKNVDHRHPNVDAIIQAVIRDALIIQKEENAIQYIAQYATHAVARERRQAYVQQILMNEVFPHLGISTDKTQKIMFMGHMCGKLVLTYIGKRSIDDRDHLANKRVEVSGVLVGDLFRTLWKRFIRTIVPQLTKRMDILTIISKMNVITMGLRHCFSTGNWGIPKSNYVRTGVSQVLSRMSFNSTLSHLRRVVIPIGKEGRNTKIRQVHPTQIGFMCPSETPEGSSAGIVKNFSLISEVSTAYDSILVRMVVETMPGIETRFSEFLRIDSWIKVMVNGNWIGIVRDAEETLRYLGRCKEIHRLPSTVSFCRDGNEIRIYCDEGRLIRPFFNARSPYTGDLRGKNWDELVREGVLVWKDAHELENLVVAMYPNEITRETDLCEIHPCLLLGICASLMPFADHTQSPRICYHASMVKQSIGVYAGTNEIRADTVAHVLSYPEKPIVRTHVEEWFGMDKMPCGNNVIVAIACYGGWNQEDSIILNQSSVDRGLFRSFTYRTLMVEEKKKTSANIETIHLPPVESRIRSFYYGKLGSNGIVRPNVFVGSGDVIVAKTAIHQLKTGKEETIDTSVVVKNGEEGYVDKVFISTTPDGYKMVKIKIRTLKIPEIGDKLCSNCAQKGTIGMTFRREDMPFTPDGIVPDIIINPLCIPSRMTINQLMECIGAKSAVLRGRSRYATTFSRHSVGVVEQLKDELHRCGYERNGNEIMINGITGKAMDAEIFIGPCYYHRLKHLVSSKIHARNHGKVSQLTHQPLEGRSRDGGLRFGEMERDAVRGDTAISLTCGISIRVDQMYENGWSVLSWSQKEGGIVPSRQVDFLDKGMRDCYEVTLENGQKLYPSIRHPFLTSGDEWIRANAIVPNETVLKTSLQFPLVDIQADMEICYGWSLLDRYKTDTVKNYLDTLAFARLLGLLMTDGHILQYEKSLRCSIFLGHNLDVQSCVEDILRLEPLYSYKEDMSQNTYRIDLPRRISNDIQQIEGILIGSKMTQPLIFPNFIMDPNCPLPVLREFLGAMFGGDGHTCYLGMHRGKRDLMTSISFSRSARNVLLPTLESFFDDFIHLLNRFDITKLTCQKSKENTNSKKQNNISKDERTYSIVLHFDIDELIPFSEKIGFRHCFHKAQRLQAAVCYYRLRSNVKRQHDWIVRRVDAITNFSEIKKAHPTKIVGTKKAIEQAVRELKDIEPLLHEYAIPTTHDITDHLIKGTSFGKFRSTSFPTAEEYMRQIGAYDWFVSDDKERQFISYGTKRDLACLQTLNLKVVSMKPIGKYKVYDIQVDDTESFLANGVVAHNCMISHGNSRFLLERLFDMSDPFRTPICSECGAMPSSTTYCSVCQGTQIRVVPMPYACKLLFQELNAMGIRINLFPERATLKEN